jgi:hypothetical protein
MDHKRRRQLENKNEQGDKRYLARGRYCKIYNILHSKMVWTCWKDAKLKNAKTNCSGYNRTNKEKKKTTQTMEGWSWRGLKYNRNKKNAVARDRRNWRKIVLQAEVHNRPWCLRRRRMRRKRIFGSNFNLRPSLSYFLHSDTCYISSPSHKPLFYNPNNIWPRDIGRFLGLNIIFSILFSDTLDMTRSQRNTERHHVSRLCDKRRRS